jgi:hypothetical protein
MDRQPGDHSAINGGLQENLVDFLARHSIVQRSAQVYAKFVSAIQRHHHRQRDHAARLPGEDRGGSRLLPRRSA